MTAAFEALARLIHQIVEPGSGNNVVRLKTGEAV
jgi:hypothetical protein